MTSDICCSLGEFIFAINKGNLFSGLHSLKYKIGAMFAMSFLTHVGKERDSRNSIKFIAC